VAYRFGVGPFNLAFDILHTCDNPPCCNPAHLFVGTAKINLQDASRKGRTARLRGEAANVHKLTWAKVREIRRLVADGAPTRHVAAEFGVTQATISHITTKKTWVE
jgi:hypothetical protein